VSNRLGELCVQRGLILIPVFGAIVGLETRLDCRDNILSKLLQRHDSKANISSTTAAAGIETRSTTTEITVPISTNKLRRQPVDQRKLIHPGSLEDCMNG
jgi:hypothetical protein